MNPTTNLLAKLKDTLSTYWMLVRITVPVAILAELLSRLGFIKAVAPVFAPVMKLIGLPPELGLAWLTGSIVGMWGAIPLVFTLVPVSSLSVADVTVFSALILIVHGLPAEQQILKKAGPGIAATMLLRVLGGFLYAFLLRAVLDFTGWLSEPVDPAWIPMSAAADWLTYLQGLFEAMISMFAILCVLTLGLEILKWSGLLALIMKVLSPVLRLAGIKDEAGHLTAVGFFLGISYGAGLLVQEAKSAAVPPRQIFLSCIFMCFAHSVIEDTLLVLALGADVYGVLAGRLVFAVAATALVAKVLQRLSDQVFYGRAFTQPA